MVFEEGPEKVGNNCRKETDEEADQNIAGIVDAEIDARVSDKRCPKEQECDPGTIHFQHQPHQRCDPKRVGCVTRGEAEFPLTWKKIW